MTAFESRVWDARWARTTIHQRWYAFCAFRSATGADALKARNEASMAAGSARMELRTVAEDLEAIRPWLNTGPLAEQAELAWDAAIAQMRGALLRYATSFGRLEELQREETAP